MQLSEYPFHDLLRLSTMTLATASPEGEPHAAPVYFATLEMPLGESVPLCLYFFSEWKSRHSHDICATGQAAAAIYPVTQDWQEIRGLQMRGRVRAVPSGEEWQSAWRSYRQKFPFVRALKQLIAQNILYGLSPAWMRLVDNRLGFGYKQEWVFQNDGA